MSASPAPAATPALRLLTPPDGSFGAAVRTLRLARGWSQYRLGLEAGLGGLHTVRDVEEGRTTARRQTAVRLADAFGLDGAERRAFLTPVPVPTRRPTTLTGALLRRHSAAAGLSRYALATRAGCDESYLTRLENGEKTAPSRAMTIALATALDLDDGERDDLLLAAGHLPSWATDVTIRQCAALLACLPGPAARRLRDQVAAAWERERGGDE